MFSRAEILRASAATANLNRDQGRASEALVALRMAARLAVPSAPIFTHTSGDGAFFRLVDRPYAAPGLA